LSAIVVPTGGWVFAFTLSDAAGLDTALTATIPAGTYYMAWDFQADDLLDALVDAVSASMSAYGAPFNAATSGMFVWIDATTHKIKIGFDGTVFQGATRRQVKLRWTASTAGLVAALGFDATADDTLTAVENPIFTADYHHGYGWYADDDGFLVDDLAVDAHLVKVQHARGDDGTMKAQLHGDCYSNRFALSWLPRAKTFSNGKGYGDAPLHPALRNEPLECWWRTVRDGTQFRFYEDGKIVTGKADEAGTATAGSSTTLTDSGRAWATEPYRWVGALLYLANVGISITVPQRHRINSHTATVLTFTSFVRSPSVNGKAYHIFDQQYGTYQIDFDQFTEFRPTEISKVPQWSIEVPLIKYVAA
jgi:hypothetical protein